MILHVTFTDGSNPWVSLPADRHTIAKHWRRWMKTHPDTARPVAYVNEWLCELSPAGGKMGFIVCSTRGSGMKWEWYKTLIPALAALERLGGETR